MDNVRLFITQSRVSTVRRDEPAVGYGGRRNLGSLCWEPSDLCFELVYKNFERVICPQVTLCGWRDVKIQELTCRRDACFHSSDTATDPTTNQITHSGLLSTVRSREVHPYTRSILRKWCVCFLQFFYFVTENSLVWWSCRYWDTANADVRSSPQRIQSFFHSALRLQKLCA